MKDPELYERPDEYEVPVDPWPQDAVELRIYLKGSKPPVWRKIVVHPATGMEEMHRIIAILFEMDKGQEHRFQAGKVVLRPGDAGYDGRRIAEFPPGKALIYGVGEGTERSFNVKVVSNKKRRAAYLPMIAGGMRKLVQAEGEGPYDIDYLDFRQALWPFRRYDDPVPDRQGNMVEPWRATALVNSAEQDRAYEEFWSKLGQAKRPRTFTPLRPVPEKVPPGTPVELKITLQDMPVPVWRTVLVGADISFAELHEVIQKVMGWESYHMYQFEVGDSFIQPFDEDMETMYGTELIDASLIRLRDLLTGQGWSVEYQYDFGDGWTHRVEAIKVREPRSEFVPPELLGGAGACPPEDSGGPYGYIDLIKAANDPKNKEHKEVVEWLGKDRLDPSEFDLEAARKRFAYILWLL